jgi:hypothetical protein
MGHHITYVPRMEIKSQVMADFVAVWIETQTSPPLSCIEYWTMYFDRSVQGTSAGAVVIIVSSSGDRLWYTIRLHFPASNNMQSTKHSSTGYASLPI